ncbi:MAG: hypothetical protein SWC40_04090, partial [Thermodesulfobacteriota bacterium]|nr:hypothetical protein [Thermodesulfobacteriota bacterium]
TIQRAAIDADIARHAPQETLYDQPFTDRKHTRVSGPFTVEAVPAPAVKSVEDILVGGRMPRSRCRPTRPLPDKVMGADLLLLVPKLQLGNTSVQKLQLR